MGKESLMFYVAVVQDKSVNEKMRKEKETNKRHVRDNDQKNSSFVSAISSMSCHSICSSQHFSYT